eukprot:11167903-Prorocentrum_lima.AAC.1
MPTPPQTSMSHSGAAYSIGSESVVNRMAQREVVRPKHFHSRNAPSFEPPLKPSLSAAAPSNFS